MTESLVKGMPLKASKARKSGFGDNKAPSLRMKNREDD